MKITLITIKPLAELVMVLIEQISEPVSELGEAALLPGFLPLLSLLGPLFFCLLPPSSLAHSSQADGFDEHPL